MSIFLPCQHLDKKAMLLAKEKLNNIAKPLDSMGKLEDIIVRMAGIFETASFDISKKITMVMCADNGVVEEGVTQTGQEITAVVAKEMAKGQATISLLSKKAGADVAVVDVGIASDVSGNGILDYKVRKGTRNFYNTPAMTREETEKAIRIGMDLVKEYKEKGYNIIATGEMGIGNTTSSSAVISCLLGDKPADVTGRGAGLSSDGLKRKVHVIETALDRHEINNNDAIDVLSKVGGLDIAALTGVFLGGAAYRVPIIIDGLISSTAALCAIKIAPQARDFMFASHISYEPAGKHVLDALKVDPILDLHMCLGEGTGAVMAFPIFDMAMVVYDTMQSFTGMQIDKYEKYDEE